MENPRSECSYQPVNTQLVLESNSGNENSVDYILVSKCKKSTDPNYRSDEANEHMRWRKIFESNLQKEGLIIEYDRVKEKEGLTFVKIMVPNEVLIRYADILKLRLPMKQVNKDIKETEIIPLFVHLFQDTESFFPFQFDHKKELEYGNVPIASYIRKRVRKRIDSFRQWFMWDTTKLPEMKYQLTAVFSKDKDYL